MEYITPLIIASIIITAFVRKRPVYHDFVSGATDGAKLLLDIFPPLVAMLTASAMLKASGALDIAVDFISPLTQRIGISGEVMPLIMIRPVSGSGAIGILSGVLKDYGADSYVGRLASVICGSTETTFYCLAVYLAKTRVKNIRRAIPCAVIGDLAGIAAAAFALNIMGM